MTGKGKYDTKLYIFFADKINIIINGLRSFAGFMHQIALLR